MVNSPYRASTDISRSGARARAAVQGLPIRRGLAPIVGRASVTAIKDPSLSRILPVGPWIDISALRLYISARCSSLSTTCIQKSLTAISRSNPELTKIRLPTLRLRYPIRPSGWDRNEIPLDESADCSREAFTSEFPGKTFID